MYHHWRLITTCILIDHVTGILIYAMPLITSCECELKAISISCIYGDLETFHWLPTGLEAPLMSVDPLEVTGPTASSHHEPWAFGSMRLKRDCYYIKMYNSCRIFSWFFSSFPKQDFSCDSHDKINNNYIVPCLIHHFNTAGYTCIQIPVHNLYVNSVICMSCWVTIHMTTENNQSSK